MLRVRTYTIFQTYELGTGNVSTPYPSYKRLWKPIPTLISLIEAGCPNREPSGLPLMVGRGTHPTIPTLSLCLFASTEACIIPLLHSLVPEYNSLPTPVLETPLYPRPVVVLNPRRQSAQRVTPVEYCLMATPCKGKIIPPLFPRSILPNVS